MQCPLCKADTRVMQTKTLRAGVARRRKCESGHLSYSVERPIRENLLFKTRKKPKKKPLPAPEPPALEFHGIPVTKDSPDWLKRVADLVG